MHPRWKRLYNQASVTESASALHSLAILITSFVLFQIVQILNCFPQRGSKKQCFFHPPLFLTANATFYSLGISQEGFVLSAEVSFVGKNGRNFVQHACQQFLPSLEPTFPLSLYIQFAFCKEWGKMPRELKTLHTKREEVICFWLEKDAGLNSLSNNCHRTL